MKKSVLMIFAAALLASCASSELINPNAPTEVDGPDAIVLKSSHIDAVTRMPYTGAISKSNPLPARVLGATASSKYQDKASQHVDGTMIFKGGIASFEAKDITYEAGRYPTTGDGTLYLCGLAPSGRGEGGWSLDGDNSASFTFSGKEDAMAAGEVVTSKALVEGGEIPSLTFSHLLTKLEVSLKAETPASVALWGTVERIELVKVDGNDPENKVTVSLKDAKPEFSGSTTDLLFYAMNVDGNRYTDELYSDNAQRLDDEKTITVAYSMIAPFKAEKTKKKLLFNIYTSNTPTAIPNEVSVDLDFDGTTEGRAFGITFLFPGDNEAIIGTATVIDWVDSGSVTTPVE